MPSYRAEAIVLRTHKLGEADRIITFLTRERGKVRAVAKGVRRTKSRFGARLEPFSRVDLLLHEGKNLDIITQAESLNAYGQELAIDYSLWTAGQTMLETADRLTSETSVSAEPQYLLLVGALRTLVSGEHDSTLVLNAYLLRALALAGYSPSLDACIVCGTVGAQPFFHVPSGGALCFEHRVPGSVAPKEQTIEIMQALLQGDWQKADQATGAQLNEISGIVAAFTQWHLEKSLRSLPLVDRTNNLS
jgi:DNA repair protein RecO (recombination protein O)